MAKEGSRTDAVEILRRRFVDGDATRAAEVERERTNAEVAQLIYDRRVAAGLTHTNFPVQLCIRRLPY